MILKAALKQIKNVTMAKVTDVFVSGTVENLVFYRRMGKSCTRIKRAHIKQTASTKIRSLNFGVASKAAKGLRNGLLNVMPLPTDRSMQSRLPGAIAKWMGLGNVGNLQPCDAVSALINFQFTADTPFSYRFKPAITTTWPLHGGITVSIGSFIPVQDIQAPPKTSAVLLTVTVAGCLLQSGEPAGSATHSVMIPYNETELPAQSLDLDIPVAQGSLIVTCARLQYYVNGDSRFNITRDAAWQPAAVVGARYV